MNTITKLNIAVNNDALPIITEDGHLVNSHVAQYVALLSEKGYTLTAEELNAVSALVDDAIAHGWLRYVDYFFPFIGNKTHLAASMVPLIDRFTGGDVYQDTPLTDTMFTYKDDAVSIKAFGRPDIPPVASARGLVINKTYAPKNQLFGISPDSDFTPIMDKSSAVLTLCGFAPVGFESITDNSRTVRTIRGRVDDNELYLYRYTQSGAAAQSPILLYPRVPLDSIDSDIVLHINGQQANGEYTQYCVQGDGRVLRDMAGVTSANSYLATPALPFIGCQNVAPSGNMIVSPPFFSVMVFGVLNEITSGDINRAIGVDVLKFLRAIGKID